MAQGSTVVEAGNQIRVTRKTSYRWRDAYAGTRKWQGRVGAKTLYIEPGPPNPDHRGRTAAWRASTEG